MKQKNLGVITNEQDEDWYSYSKGKRWANVMLSDGKYKTSLKNYTTNGETKVSINELGSMFVWIPRYAYKITPHKDEAGNESGGYHTNITGDIEIKFLIGTTNDTVDKAPIVEYNETTTANYTKFPENGYVVHPAFTSNVNVGGWGREITGFWMAKFEAGYPMKEIDPTKQVDEINKKTESNFYYPVFKGQRYSYNNTKIGDLYITCEQMTGENNPYEITDASNSHMIKNSEWGAVAYLTRSKYGKTDEIYPNNVSFENSKKNIQNSSVYSLTGYSATGDNAVNKGTNNVSGKEIGEKIEGTNGISTVWYLEDGFKASTTGNIYGIYDMSGGCYEYTAAVIPSGHININNYGGTQFSSLTKSTNKITLYPVGKSTSNATDISRSYSEFGKIYGDAIWETSSQTGGGNSWNGDHSDGDVDDYQPFLVRGEPYYNGSQAGIFSFEDTNGKALLLYVFTTRTVLCK